MQDRPRLLLRRALVEHGRRQPQEIAEHAAARERVERKQEVVERAELVEQLEVLERARDPRAARAGEA